MRKAKIIKASTALQSKIGTGTVSEDVVARAQTVIEENEVDFQPIALPLLNTLRDAIKTVRDENLSDEEAFNVITQPIMNLKANATTFKFPLVGTLTGTVLTLIEHARIIDSEILVIADNLHKAATIAVTQNLADLNNPVGATLVSEFQGVCKRYMDKRLN